MKTRTTQEIMRVKISLLRDSTKPAGTGFIITCPYMKLEAWNITTVEAFR